MKEIGGQFHLPVSLLFKRPLYQFDRFIANSTQYYLTSSGRDSLVLIINALGLSHNCEVLLPAYLCGEILRPFKEANIKFTFYKINADLSIDINDIEKRITKETKILLVIHYFGYPQPIEELQKLSREHSLLLIEDSVQSFLTRYNGKFLGCFGDVAFNSFIKFLPVLDGSLLLLNNKEIKDNWQNLKLSKRSLNYLAYISLRFLAMSIKSLSVSMGIIPKPLFLWLFAEANKMFDKYPKPVRISFISKTLLESFNFDHITWKRRRNFQYLLDNWHSDIVQPLFHELPTDVCPLGFPVVVKGKRDHIKEELIKRKVYPPIHWNLPPDIDKEEFKTSWKFSQEVLTIPVDQRYQLKDMEYILRQIEVIEGNQ